MLAVAFLASPAAVAVWQASGAAGGSDPTSIISAGGTAGLILALVYAVVAYTRGWVVPGRRYDAEIARRDADIAAKDAELRQTRDFIRDQLVPLLTRTQDVLGKTLEERAWDDRARRQREP